MVKELAAYYKTSMLELVHRMIDAAFQKTLAKVEAEDIKNRQEEEEYKARIAARRKEREDANKINDPTVR
jgi:acetyl-CoA carboxylase beta subunit